VTIAMGAMIHKIHNGINLANGYEVAGFPSDPAGTGFPNYNLHVYSEVVYPVFVQGATDCDSCHAGAADLPDPNAAFSHVACGTCHDDVNFETGENHDGGIQTNDALCAACHLPSEIETAHGLVRDNPAWADTGLIVDVIGISPGSGTLGQLLPGDTITVEYTLTDDFGAPLTTADLASATAIVSGPIDHMQWMLESATGDVIATSTQNPVTGVWSYTFVATLPDVYPAQKNDTADLGLEQGDWVGQPLVDGTYRVALNAYRVVFDDVGEDYRKPNADVEEVLVGEGATVLGSRDVVAEDSCLACHVRMEFHGEGRESVDYCTMCHTAGAEDRNSATDPTSTPAATIGWQTMVHRMHMGEGLTLPYELVGFGDVLHSYNEIVFPRFDGGVRACDACHADSEAWLDPQTAACTSCHDSTDTAAHAALNTDPVFGESCDVCHDSSSLLAVEDVHAGL
jgi:hypothetical protein